MSHTSWNKAKSSPPGSKIQGLRGTRIMLEFPDCKRKQARFPAMAFDAVRSPPLRVGFKAHPEPRLPRCGYLWNSWRAATTLSESGCGSQERAMSSFSWACSRATRGSSAARAIRVACAHRPNQRDAGESAGGEECGGREKPVTRGRDWGFQKLSLCSPALGPDFGIRSHHPGFCLYHH